MIDQGYSFILTMLSGRLQECFMTEEDFQLLMCCKSCFLALQDRVVEDIKNKRNVVEAYVYNIHNNLHVKYKEFVTPPIRDQLTKTLQGVEDWLYNEDKQRVLTIEYP